MGSAVANVPLGDDQIADAAGIPSMEARHRLLLDANINPSTGLATDYLNHFNEAIMLLEMIPDMPECAADFLTWQPTSYREHFAAPTPSAPACASGTASRFRCCRTVRRRPAAAG